MARDTDQHGTRAGKPRRRPKLATESIEAVLTRWLKKNRAEERLDSASIYEKWRDVVGEAIASDTRVIDLNAGVLLIEVNSPALLQELSTYYREELLDSMKSFEEFASIRDIKFRAGSF
jgi:predicted nucleic acid-binding Zn ribbon protein